MIARNSLSQIGQLSSALCSFFEQKAIGLRLPLSSRWAIQAPRVKSEESVSSLIYRSGSNMCRTVSKMIMSLIRLNTYQLLSVYLNSCFPFVILVNGKAIPPKFLMNLRQQLVNPRKDYTSLILVSVGQSRTALVFFRFIRISLGRMICPRNSTYTWKKLFDGLIRSFVSYSAQRTLQTCSLYSLRLSKKIRISLR